MSTGNKQIVQAHIEAFRLDDREAQFALTTSEWQGHLPAGAVDRERMFQGNSRLNAISSDWTYTINRQIAEGDMVATYVTWRCTHDRGHVGDIAPTGKKLVLTVMRFDRIVDGKIAETWFEDSFERFLKQAMAPEEA